MTSLPLLSTHPCRVWRALSTFLSLSLSWSKVAPDDIFAPGFCVRFVGRCTEDELVLEVCGVILVSREELDSGRGEGRDRGKPWLLASMLHLSWSQLLCDAVWFGQN